MQLEGIYTPLITPFCRNLSLDYDAYGAAIDWQIDNGVHGVIVGGSTGEFHALTTDERIEQLYFAARRIDGRIPMIAGVNDLLATRTEHLAAAARDAGASALLVAAPPYSLPGAAELVAHCRRIDRVAGLPIILYNYPARTGVDLDADFLGRAVRIENICAIKESSGSVERIHTLVQQFPELQLSAGTEDLVLEFFAWGARSWVSVIANFMPQAAVRLYEMCVLENDFAAGRRLMQQLLPLMLCLERGGAFLQSVKLACELHGRPGGPVRPPLAPLGKAQQRDVTRIVRDAGRAVDNVLAQ
ncbi:MAG: dihydrodipicolinate synthase family protein [Woeseiaceae bacterium]|nr:dihydrodipicolinate synthase family protein [Woeseiaceae bacterium]